MRLFLRFVRSLLIRCRVGGDAFEVTVRGDGVVFFRASEIAPDRRSVEGNPFMETLLPFPFARQAVFVAPTFGVRARKDRFLHFRLGVCREVGRVRPGG